ncbi:MAG: hypothetical protein ACTSRZ_05260 [Promethearchaeota archaeon]
MKKLYEIGLNYAGLEEYCESDFVVFDSKEEAEDYITRAAVKVMITKVDEDKQEILQRISQKYFHKKAEEITNEDVDNLPEISKIYNELLKIQNKNSGVSGYFVDEINVFTDIYDNEYEIILKPKK